MTDAYSIPKDDYRKEIIETLKKLAGDIPASKEFSWFLKCIGEFHLQNIRNKTADIAVLGSGIPEELLIASKKRVVQILGGSRISLSLADDLVPRDTDPISRSSLGCIKTGITKQTLILIPLINDSARKLAYLLNLEGYKVYPLYFPPMKDNESKAEWERQYENLKTEIERHCKKSFGKGKLLKARDEIRNAKALVREFIKASEDTLSGTVRMLVINSYYCTNNLREWCDNLTSLTVKLNKIKTITKATKCKVMIMGSPIYFPNYKVPVLIEEAYLSVALQIDYSSLTFYMTESGSAYEREKSQSDFFENDSSPAYVKNNTLYEGIRKIVLS